MAMDPQKFNKLNQQQDALNNKIDAQNASLERQESSFSRIFDLRGKAYRREQRIVDEQKKINNILEKIQKQEKKGIVLSQQQKDLLDQRVKSHEATIRALKTKQVAMKALFSISSMISKIPVAGFWKFLMEADSAIKSTNLELGFTGEKANILRQNFYDAAENAAVLGATIKDVKEAQMGFTEETGKARALSAEALESIIKIGKGTALGVKNAGQLTGQFDLLGISVRQSADYVEETIEVSERMGVNATKVIGNLVKNFNKLKTFTFKNGVKDMASMANYAEKFNIDMGQMLDSAEKARTLEGAVELAAQLQVMGGEFAKSDPFELLFLSRNDPEEYTKKINEMTKGIVQWKKDSDGVMQKFISPADRDRMFAVAKALGMSGEELANQAYRMADIQKIRQQMGGGLGLSDKDMEAIEGMAIMGENGRFVVDLGDDIKKDVNQLTTSEISRLLAQRKTLDQRAKDAQTFDEKLTVTLNQLKASMLPVLEGVNDVLEWAAPHLETFGESLKSFGDNFWLGVGKMFVWLAGLKALFSASGALGGAIGGRIGGAGASTLSGSQMLGKGKMAAGAGKGAMMKGAGVGAAGLGIGAGVGLAATGISQLAKSVENLDVKKMKELNNILLTMGGTMAVFAAGLTIIAFSSTVAAGPLLAFGAAALLIGGGIGLAAAGIGYMAEGMSSLGDVDLGKVAEGLAQIAAVGLGGGIGALIGAAGFGGITLAIAGIAASASGIERVGIGMKNIRALMDGDTSKLEEVKNTLQAISSIKANSNSPIQQLSNLLSKPLQVEFAEKSVGMNVELNVDGQKIFGKYLNPEIIYNSTFNTQNKGTV